MTRQCLPAIIVVASLCAFANDAFACGGCTYPTTPALTDPNNGATNQNIPGVTLTWNDSHYEMSYTVYLEAGDSTPDVVVATLSANVTSYNTGRLVSNTTYYWRIKATNSCGSRTSAIWSFTTHAIDTYYIDPNGSDTSDGLTWTTAFATIQHAVGEVDECDIVEVNEGNYSENLDLNSVTVCTLSSTDPNDWIVTSKTVIEANDSNESVVLLTNADWTVRGFTIIGGNHGIYCNGGYPAFSNCVIQGNDSNDDGGGMYVIDSSPVITDCFLVENDANYGGGVYGYNSSVTLTNCVISDNNATGDKGGALYVKDSSAKLINCTISGNDANDTDGYGGGVYNVNSALITANTVIWSNDANDGNSIYADVNGWDPNDVNLVGWWKLDETSGSIAYDSTDNGLDGTLNGEPEWSDGFVYGALDFNGTGDYVEIADADSLTPTNEITIAFWIYNNGGQNAGIYKYGSCPNESASPGNSRAYNVQIIDETGELRFRVFSAVGTSDVINSNNTLRFGEWHHIAVTFDHGYATIYIDGALDNSETMSVSSIMNDAQPLIIGGYWEYCGTDSFNSRLNGEIDDVRIYDRAIDTNEVKILANVAHYSDIESWGVSGAGWDPKYGIDGGGNIDADPCFVDVSDANGSDGVFGTSDDGLYLDPCSLGIDAADGNSASEVDILGFERGDFIDVANTGIGDPNYADMGAYEFTTGIYNVTSKTYYSTIQDAINASSTNDIIELAEGVYEGSIDFKGKAITLRSTDSNDPCVVAATVIDGNCADCYVLIFDADEDANTILDGVTVTGGGCGIYCGSSPTITRCLVTGNQENGLLAVGSSGPLISKCAFVNNGISPTYRGSGVYLWGTTSAVVVNCVLTRNDSKGIFVYNTTNSAEVINCTIYGNFDYGIIGQPSIVKDCIIWDNDNDLYSCSATYSCIQDMDSGQGNIHVYPLFVDADNNDFHLQPGSFCIDAGDPCSSWYNEPNGGGGRINMGAYGNTENATTIVDLDSDGVDDFWELAYLGGSDPNMHDPTGDPDADGLLNIDEYRIGWDPNSDDSNSITGIVHINRADANYPDTNYPSISKAIDFAFDNDTLILEPNTTFYEKEVSFSGKPIIVRSIDPNDPNIVASTIIDANDTSKNVIVFDSGEDLSSVLEGVTIRGGYNGVYCNDAQKPSGFMVRKCVIRSNNLDGFRITTANTFAILRCIAVSNKDDGIDVGWDVGLTINSTIGNCVIAKNDNYGIRAYHYQNGQLLNCTIFGNKYGMTKSAGAGVLEARNCIIWGNTIDDLKDFEDPVTYSCIEDGDQGWGNFMADPAFKDVDANDYHLQPWSSCVDQGDPCSSWYNEPNGGGGRINLGAYGNTEEATVTTDVDEDGLPDQWQAYYWDDYDPCVPDANYSLSGDPDNDGFINEIEYFFGYDPNSPTDVSAEIYCGAAPNPKQIDPTQGETTSFQYWLNKTANVNVKFVNTDDVDKIARTFNYTNVPAGGPYNVTWDGTDESGLYVECYFYNVQIDANNGEYIWTNPDATELTYFAPYNGIDSSDFDPHKNIPAKFTFTSTGWLKPEITVWDAQFSVTDINVICPVLNQRLLPPGEHSFYWYGRGGDSVPNPEYRGNIYEGVFYYNETASFFPDTAYPATGVRVHDGPVLVYYDILLSNLRCHPYRIVPTYDEITKITYDLAADANVSVKVTDPDGSLFVTLVDNEFQTAGSKEVLWRGKTGDPNSPGSRYIYKEGVYRVDVKVENDNINEQLTGVITVFR